MNRSSVFVSGVALGLIVLTAVFLNRLQAFQKLGTPGVRVVVADVHGESGEVVGTNTIALPERVLDYTSSNLPLAKIVLDWLPKDTTYGQRIYRAADGFEIQASVVLMGTDRTSLHKPEYCLPGQGFHVDKMERLMIPIEKPSRYDLPIQKWTLSRDVTLPSGAKVRQQGLFVFWFVADNQLTADHNQRMWWMARDLILRGTLQRWAYTSLFTVFAPRHDEAAFGRMKELITAIVPEFQPAPKSASSPATLTSQR